MTATIEQTAAKLPPSGAVTDFTTVDHTADPTFFLRFLDAANAESGAAEWKPTMLEALHLRPGAQALDVGCGAGADAFDLAAKVAPSGHVTGVDTSGSLIAEARRRAAGRNLPVTFETGDAHALGFPSGSFDAVRCERLLMHVLDPVQVLSEMVRVLRPGGFIAVHDIDWDTQFCDTASKEVTRKITGSFSDAMKQGWIGRRLPRYAAGLGLTDLRTSIHAITVTYGFLELLLGGHVARIVSAGMLSEEEANRWWTELGEADRAGTYLYGFTTFVVSGRKSGDGAVLEPAHGD